MAPATATFTGKLASGAGAAPGEAIAVTFAGVTKQALIGPAGIFTVTFATSGLTVSASPGMLTFSYTSDGIFASTSTTRSLMVTKATPTVDVADAGGTFNGTPFQAAATVTGVTGGSAGSLEGISPVLSFFSGTFTTTAQLAGLTPLAGAPSQSGSYTVVGRFAGSPDFVATESVPVNFTISPAGTHVILVQHPIRKHKKVVSVRLTAEVESLHSRRRKCQRRRQVHGEKEGAGHARTLGRSGNAHGQGRQRGQEASHGRVQRRWQLSVEPNDGGASAYDSALRVVCYLLFEIFSASEQTRPPERPTEDFARGATGLPFCEITSLAADLY